MAFFEFTVAIGFSLFAFGILVGTIAPTFGIGGGLLNVPLLLLIYSNRLNLDSYTATSTSLGIIFFTALSGTLSYAKEKRIDYILLDYTMINKTELSYFTSYIYFENLYENDYNIIFEVKIDF